MSAAILIASVVIFGGFIYIAHLLRAPKKSEPDQSFLLLDQRLSELTKQMGQQLEHSRQAAERSAGSPGQLG
jgi:hypothetical protein